MIGDPNADYRNDTGRILEGPEYLTIFDGETGEELVTTDFSPARGNICDWGDCYGNRGDRFLAAIAYLDGERPSLVMARGYYEKTMLTAYNYRNGQLSRLWTFDSDDPGNEGYAGQGNHNLSVADVDGDGRDEIIYGACAIDDNGQGLYTTGLGHGDAMHLSDLDPNRSGMEVFQVHESSSAAYGIEFRDADSGQTLWGIYTGEDTGRGMAADIDPRYEGAEVWGSGGFGLFSSTGEQITAVTPGSINFGIWWDGDLRRELLDHDWLGSDVGAGNPKIDKWDYQNDELDRLLTPHGTYSNNWTKGTPSLQADILGDWREEAIWRTQDSSALHIYTTTDLTNHRIHTLMHDPVYRLGIAWQNVAYNQPPHTSFYLGVGMTPPPRPNIYTTAEPDDPASSIEEGTYKILNPPSGKVLDVNARDTEDGTNVQIWEDNGGLNQQWIVTQNDDGSYTLTDANSGKVLDVSGWGTEDGTNVQIWTDTGGANQHWQIIDNGDGTYKLINVHSGKALDVTDGGTENGTNVQIWTDNGYGAQKWQFIEL